MDSWTQYTGTPRLVLPGILQLTWFQAQCMAWPNPGTDGLISSRTNMSNPPPWLPSGVANYASSLEAQLAAKVMGTNNVSQAAAVMKNYTAHLGGIEATGVDLPSWRGLSAVRVYYQTGDIRQAVAQTFLAQLDQLSSSRRIVATRSSSGLSSLGWRFR